MKLAASEAKKSDRAWTVRSRPRPTMEISAYAAFIDRLYAPLSVLCDGVRGLQHFPDFDAGAYERGNFVMPRNAQLLRRMRIVRHPKHGGTWQTWG